MSNNHLSDKKYLQGLGYEDDHYLINLCQKLWEFIKNAPVPVYTSIFKNKQDNVFIKLAIGDISQVYRVDVNIYPFDFIYRFKQFAMLYYPQFEFTESIEAELETEEMLEKVANTEISLNEVVFLTKTVEILRKGIIQKVTLLKDEFLFENDGKKEVRTSLIADKIEDILPVKKFIQHVRCMYYGKEDGKKIRDYIIENSKCINILPDEENEVIINYPNNMMRNFIKIHFEELKDLPLNKETSLVYTWGKFKLIFTDDLTEQECIKYYGKRRQTYVHNFNLK